MGNSPIWDQSVWSGEVKNFLSKQTSNIYEESAARRRQMNEDQEKNATAMVENIVRTAVQSCLSRTVKISKTVLSEQDAMMVLMKVEQDMVGSMAAEITASIIRDLRTASVQNQLRQEQFLGNLAAQQQLQAQLAQQQAYMIDRDMAALAQRPAPINLDLAAQMQGIQPGQVIQIDDIATLYATGKISEKVVGQLLAAREKNEAEQKPTPTITEGRKLEIK